jgi:hypothetical protein
MRILWKRGGPTLATSENHGELFLEKDSGGGLICDK